MGAPPAVRGRDPAACVLGVTPSGAAAVVRQGRLLAVEAHDDPWTAVARALAAGGLGVDGVEQVAVACPPGRLRWLSWAHAARRHLGQGAAHRGRGVVGTGLPRRWDRRDRLTLHPPSRSRAAAAYYAQGQRSVLVVLRGEDALQGWLGTSGKLVDLPLPEGTGLVELARRVGAEVVVAEPGLAPGYAAPRLVGALAEAAGAAWLAWADERQGAWTPAPWPSP